MSADRRQFIQTVLTSIFGTMAMKALPPAAPTEAPRLRTHSIPMLRVPHAGGETAVVTIEAGAAAVHLPTYRLSVKNKIEYVDIPPSPQYPLYRYEPHVTRSGKVIHKRYHNKMNSPHGDLFLSEQHWEIELSVHQDSWMDAEALLSENWGSEPCRATIAYKDQRWTIDRAWPIEHTISESGLTIKLRT